jgi:RNA polymerase sigma-70 factor (ECF subfamily)
LKRPPERKTEDSSAGLDEPLKQIYATHFAFAWRSLRRLGVPLSMLEDAAQDVFLVVHRRWADFEGRSSIKTWLYGIVLRVAKDYRRAEARHANRVERLAEHASAYPVRAISPTEEAERREANHTVNAILSTLSDAHREVFVLVELEGIVVQEAAAALGIHLRACQRRLRAAREAFDVALENHLAQERRRTR